MFRRINIVCAVLCTIGTVSSLYSQRQIGAQLFSTGGEVTVEILFSSSGYTNEFRLFQPTPEQSIGTNKQTGKTVTLGPFSAGSELITGIVVQNTGETFKIGPGSRNPDGLAHAAVERMASNVFRVGFEDLLGGGDKDYEDAVIQLSGALENRELVAPEAVPTLSEWALILLSLALAATGVYLLRLSAG